MELKPTEQLKQWLVENYAMSPTAADADFLQMAKRAVTDGVLEIDKLAKLVEDTGGLTARDVFGGKSGSVNVKAPSERYSDFSYQAKHFKTGKPVRDEKGQEVKTLSPRTYAKFGAFMKWRLGRNGYNVQLNEHETDMVREMFSEKETWVGDWNGEYRTDLKGTQVKALLSDNTSGGVSVNPLWYDQAIITFPLLSGELFPYVELTEVPRSNVVNSASLANPTVTWTGQENASAISLFNTASLVAALNTEIYPVMLAVEIGKDELADTIVDLGRYLVETIGQRHAAELDKVIAIGDGVTQPQGIINASGIGTLPNITGGQGPLTVGDLEQLMFGVPKQYRRPDFRCCFISSDATYRRARAIPRGSDDAARVFGMDEQGYTCLDNPYRISNDLADNYLIFGSMARYRFYRRMGQEIWWETQGQTLALKNTVLCMMRARYGGRVMDSNAFVMETNAPTAG